jgi:small-conductance mechanosensitive channel
MLQNRPVLGVLTLLCCCCLPALAQKVPAEAPIELNGRTIFILKSGVGSISAQERARIVNQRLAMLAQSSSAPTLRVEKSDTGLVVMSGSDPVVSITPGDARAGGTSEAALAEHWAGLLGDALAQARQQRFAHTFWRRIGITLLVLAIAVLLLWLVRRQRARLVAALIRRRERIPELKLRGVQLISARRVFRSTLHLLQVCYAVLLVCIAVATLLLIFGQFPSTQEYARRVFLWIWQPFVQIFWGVVGYLPNLFYIAVIVVVTRFVLRTLDFFFKQAEAGVISLEPWVQRDVARPTSQILKAILVVLALFFIAPLIPGTGSTAARGLSVIIGLAISFGSSSTVGNMIAGIILTYMRPFQIGDRVKIGDSSGDVLEKTFLYTKVLTIKNEEVVVPSLQVLSASMINYSARAKSAGLILHTSVTIGYDAPWRKVHELLLRAAANTGGILQEPKPFVLQTALNDFFVTYQLNAYTDQANNMANIYSELHQNIQDSFNEGGIEILSPHYMQLRDGNMSTIAARNQGDGCEARRFLVDSRVSTQEASASKAG